MLLVGFCNIVSKMGNEYFRSKIFSTFYVHLCRFMVIGGSRLALQKLILLL